jgi:hypothetical protein
MGPELWNYGFLIPGINTKKALSGSFIHHKEVTEFCKFLTNWFVVFFTFLKS